MGMFSGAMSASADPISGWVAGAMIFSMKAEIGGIDIVASILPKKTCSHIPSTLTAFETQFLSSYATLVSCVMRRLDVILGALTGRLKG